MKNIMKKDINLDTIPEEDLLKLRISDLPIEIENTWLESCIKKLREELHSRGILFNPEVYLSDEWLTPEFEPVIGIPFFLAHPRLIKLEKKMMLDAEGDTRDWCMMLLRHETGHAINYAYKFYKKRKWHNVFGAFSKEYADTYRFRPYSKNFVRHLEDYYAQYHPDEDFSETFAVWLDEESNWRDKYKGWKALNKLIYVNSLMEDIKDKEPVVKKGKKYWEAKRSRITLKNYYKKKMVFYAEDFPNFHDSNLKKIFKEKDEIEKDNMKAYILIKKYRREILNSVSFWTGERKYIINDTLKILLERVKELKLFVRNSEDMSLIRITSYITTLITNYKHTGRFLSKK